MRNIVTIAKRDVQSSFSSMIAYVVVAIFLAVVGYFFFSFTYLYARFSFNIGSDPSLQKGFNQMDFIIRPLFMNLSIVMLLVIPILTMRSLAEEKKQGTAELLFTYPLTNAEIVLGKYAGLVSVFLIMMLPTLIPVGLLALFGASVPLTSLLICYLGALLLGISFCSLGLFASSLSENQTIAAVFSFGSLLLFWLVGWAEEFVHTKWLGAFLKNVSLVTHYQNFISGLVNTNDLVYYGLFTAFFLYLTYRVVEKRTWR